MTVRRLAVPLAALLVAVPAFAWAPQVVAAGADAVDDGPIVVQENAGATTIDVLANDTDADLDVLTIVATTDGTIGTVAITNAGAELTYTPAADASGSDSFTYTVDDGNGGTDTATVTIRVNAPPVAVDDPNLTCNPAEATFLGFPIVEDYGQFPLVGPCSATANDSDPDGTITSWQIDSLPSHGTLEWLPSLPGVVGYTPDADFSSPEGTWPNDAFTYHVVDNDGAVSATATYSLTITPVNDPPTFTPGSLSISSAEDTPYSAPWATGISPGPANESDQAVRFEVTPVSGSNPNLFSAAPAVADDGTLSYTPAADQSGSLTVSVVAKDDGGTFSWGNVGGDPPSDTSDPVTLTITVTPTNDNPVAVDDSDSVRADSAGVLTSVLANDTDPDGDALTVFSAADGGKGTTTVMPDGQGVLYVPGPGEVGSDQYDYTVSDGHGGTDTGTVFITIVPNSAPDAVDDQSSLAEDAAATPIDVLGNDTDADNDQLLVTGVTQGAKGSVVITGGGTGLTYQPSPNANGADSFTYTIDDGNGGTDTATVDVTIDPVNDPPAAVDDSLTLDEDAAATAVPVLTNDTDLEADALTITTKRNGAKGVVVITGGGTGITYRPNANANGADTFTYTISDGHGGSDTATVHVTITAVNDAPNAVDDSVTVTEDAAATPVAVRANDTDVEGDPLTITAKTNGVKGAVAITGGGTGLTYQPSPNANGSDSFTYTISDGHGGTDTAIVHVTITPINDAPNAVDDSVTLNEDAAATAVPVPTNDTDADGDARTITARTNGAKGAVTISGGGTGLTYQPFANANGSDTFTYTISDGHGGTDTATVRVTITPVNDAPNAVNDPGPYTIYLKGLPRALPVLANDTSAPDGAETLRIVAVTQGSHGAVAITGGGTGLTYVATGSTLGLDVFTYTISDGHGGTDKATVQVRVYADASKPVAAITSLAASAVTGQPSNVRLTVSWTLSDTGSGLASQLLQRRTDSGSWVTVSLTSLTQRARSVIVLRGHTYTFRVRGTDRYGNVGLFATRSIKV